MKKIMMILVLVGSLFGMSDDCLEAMQDSLKVGKVLTKQMQNKPSSFKDLPVLSREYAVTLGYIIDYCNRPDFAVKLKREILSSLEK